MRFYGLDTAPSSVPDGLCWSVLVWAQRNNSFTIIFICYIAISNLNTSIVHVVNEKKAAIILKYPPLVFRETASFTRPLLRTSQKQSYQIVSVH